MAYTKPDQAAFSANLQPGELVVRIDTSPVAPVAVRCTGHVEPNTGNIVVESFARVVKANGSDYPDVNGQPIKTTYQTSMDRAGIAALGGANVLRRLMMLTVIGEDVTSGNNQLGLKWLNPPDSSILEHASIRVNIASAVDAIDVDPATLM